MTPSLSEIELFFKSRLVDLNHSLIGEIRFDTQNWQRFDCPSSPKGNQNVAYRAHSDGTPVLKVQCNKCHEKPMTFKYQGQVQLSPKQRQEIQLQCKKREAVHQMQREAALKTMELEWNNASPCITHPYFDFKGLNLTEADGLKIDSYGRVLCPIKLISGELVSTQTIPFKGKKKFRSGLSPKNGFHVFGSIDAHNEIFFAEGIATALTIRDAVNKCVICVYGKHFSDIAPIIAKAYPNKKLTYCCDLPSEGEKVTSESNARKAIALVGGNLCKPDFSMIPTDLRLDVNRSDFNDLYVLLRAQGLDETAALDIVRQQLTKNLYEEIMAEDSDDKKIKVFLSDKQPKAAEALLQLIDDGNFEFFHDNHQDAFCKYQSQKTSVYEVRRLKDSTFKSYLSFIYRKHEGKTIGEQALKEVLAELEGRALHDKSSKQEKVFIRAGEANGKIYIDICNDKWQVIEISTDGWKILDSKDIPIKFERKQHSLSLPDPLSVNKGDINRLWELVNIPINDRILILTFILECFRCNTAFVILVLLGLQDSGKSATQNTLRSLIDPSSSNLRTAPRKSDDLVIDAYANWLVSYNNVSNLSDEMHDDFCCIATGSGFATRKFFTNTDQVVVDIARPVVINGIYNFIRRPDVLDRAVISELDSIDETKRKTDSALHKALIENLPIVFRGLLDLFVEVLKHLPTITLDKMPRMADFALLGTAIEKSLKLESKTFINRYLQNRNDAKEGILEASPVMLALIDFIETQPNLFWRGRPIDLLKELTNFATPSIHTTWPKSPRKMTAELKRYTAPLKQYQIEVISETKTSGLKGREGNYYRIRKKPPQCPQPPHHIEKPNNHGASSELDSVDIGVDIADMQRDAHSNVHTPKNLANPDGAYVSEGSSGHCGHGGHLFPQSSSCVDGDNDALLI